MKEACCAGVAALMRRRTFFLTVLRSATAVVLYTLIMSPSSSSHHSRGSLAARTFHIMCQKKMRRGSGNYCLRVAGSGSASGSLTRDSSGGLWYVCHSNKPWHLEDCANNSPGNYSCRQVAVVPVIWIMGVKVVEVDQVTQAEEPPLPKSVLT